MSFLSKVTFEHTIFLKSHSFIYIIISLYYYYFVVIIMMLFYLTKSIHFVNIYII